MSLSSYLRQSFDQMIPDAIQADTWYVSLVESVPFYGGPEEGGWWGTDTHLIAFKVYPSEELAEQARAAVQIFADELKREARREHGEYCLRSMEWLEARGLDADFLPEPDGPAEYSVVVSQELPRERRGCRHYE